MENENQNQNENITVDTENENKDTVTMTQDELSRKLQGEADRVRTEYSKKVKELESKIKELTPVEKSEAEIDFENRLAALEAREKQIAFLDSLNAAGISKDFSEYLKGDADVEGFAKVYKAAVDSEVQKRVKANGYKPDSHKTGETITKEDFSKMTMDEKERLFAENPEIYKALVGR